ncbi:Uncharacterised protein [uncultured archaeon]|nr:Uncharacterised protein [uncultured archaeon]
MGKSVNQMQGLGARLRRSAAERQRAFSEVVLDAKGMKPKTLMRPRLGRRSASGPGGKWFQSDMIRNLGSLASNERCPNQAVAKKLYTILTSARGGDLQIAEYSTEAGALNELLVKLLKAKGRISLTPLQQRVLASFGV